MDPQKVIDVAMQVSAANLGAPAAADAFRNSSRAVRKVTTILTAIQRRTLETWLDFPVQYLNSSAVSSDHVVMTAMRELARDIYSTEFAVPKLLIKTLVIGASMREVSLYDDVPAINFYFGMKDAKDVDRVIVSGLRKISSRLEKKASAAEGRLRAIGGNEPSVVKRYATVQSLINDYAGLAGKHPRYHLDYVDAQVLLFEDSFYNFAEKDYLEAFARTGARVAYGYGSLPMELLFPELPANGLYGLRDIGGGRKAMYYRYGYCNGYDHDASAWSTLLRKPVMRGGSNYSFDLVVEITSYVGPIAVFKIVRNDIPDTITRAICLPKHLEYIRVLDVEASMDRRTGRRKDLVYFSVFAAEYYTLLNWMLTLADASCTVSAAMVYIRKHAGGISLVTKELEPEWQLDPTIWQKTAVLATMHARLLRSETDGWMDQFKPRSVYERILDETRNRVTESLAWILTPALCYGWLFSEDMLDKFVLMIDPVRLQSMTTRPRSVKAEPIPFTPVFPEIDKVDCPICSQLAGRLGKQILKCEHRDTRVLFKVTTEQLAELQVKLNDSDNLVQALGNVMKRASQRLPTVGFEHAVTMHYIMGGPGTGKSHIIRQLATPADLVVAPFSRLRKDYMNLPAVDGRSYDLCFKTQHRALETSGCRRIFVDEFTAFPFEFLQIAAYLNCAEEVYIVGDTKQTKIRESEDEGMYIGNHIDIDALGKHTLLRNFRNPAWTVAYLNKVHGYEMEALSGNAGELRVCRKEHLPTKLPRCLQMAFSHASCNLHELKAADGKHISVRSCQGQTDENVVLYVGADDGVMLEQPELLVVAMSRHRHDLYVVVDGSPQADAFVQRLGINDHADWIGEIPRHDPADYDAEGVKNQVEVDKWLWDQEARVVVNEAPQEPAIADSVEADDWYDAPEGIQVQDSDMSESTFVESQTEAGPDSASSLGSVQIVTVESETATRAVETGEGVAQTDTPSFFSALAAACRLLLPARTIASRRFRPVRAAVAGLVMTSGTVVGAEMARLPTGAVQIATTEYDMARLTYVPCVPLHTLAVSALPESVTPGIKDSSPVALEHLRDLLLPATATHECPSANLLSSAIVSPDFRSGKYDRDMFCPVSARGHLKSMTSTYYSLATGNGLHFGAKKPAQTLAVLQARYIGSKRKYPFDERAELLARQIADNFADTCMCPVKFDETEMQTLLTEFDKSADAKHYAAQYVGVDNPDVTIVRFALKDIYKAKGRGEPDLFKPGQGISAWSKDLQVLFGPAMRILNKGFKDSLLPHVYYDNRETEEAMRAAVQRMFTLTPATASFAQCDWTMMDSVQNEFTQAIERHILRRMGCSETFIDHYYRFRKNYRIVADGVYARGGSEKTSGEPGTLLLNSIICGTIALWIVRGEGPFALVIKGDDSITRQANQYVDQERLAQINDYVDLKVTVDIGEGAEFCGNAICNGLVVPFIVRKWYKVAAHRFRDYAHFCEYQASLRDWNQKLNAREEELLAIYGANAMLGGCTVNEVETVHNLLKNISHFSEEQFRQLFELRYENMPIPRPGGLVEVD